MVRYKVFRIQVSPLTCQVSHVTVVSSVFTQHQFFRIFFILGFRCQTVPQNKLFTSEKNLYQMLLIWSLSINLHTFKTVNLSKIQLFTCSKIVLLYHKIWCCGNVNETTVIQVDNSNLFIYSQFFVNLFDASMLYI